MPIDVQQVGVVAKVGHHVGVPNFGQLRAWMHKRLLHCRRQAATLAGLAGSPLTTRRRQQALRAAPSPTTATDPLFSLAPTNVPPAASTASAFAQPAGYDTALVNAHRQGEEG